MQGFRSRSLFIMRMNNLFPLMIYDKAPTGIHDIIYRILVEHS